MDKPISELIEALSVGDEDLYVLEQGGEAKKLKWATFIKYALARLDGHGGIRSIEKTGTSGLLDTYTITLADDTAYDIAVKNGRGIQSISKTGSSGLADIFTITYNDGTAGTFTVTNGRGITSFVKTGTEGLVDTYTITYNDGTSGTITVKNGEKGDPGDNAYVWIKWASQQPTEESHSMGDVPDDWMGVYSGGAATAPTDWKQYKWYKMKGEKGDTGDPATLVSAEVTYQVSDSGTILPSGEWSTTIPVVPQGKYLWTRIVQRFNTGDPVTAYTISRMGMDGLGSVSSVCGISPDAEGNVALTASDVGALADTGGDLTGELRMNGQPITGLNDPVGETDAARKGYVDKRVPLDGSKAMEGDLPMGGNKITGLGTPTEDTDGANKGYADKVASKASSPRQFIDNPDFEVAQAGHGGYHGSNYYVADRWLCEGVPALYAKYSDRYEFGGNEDYLIVSQKTDEITANYLIGKTVTLAVKKGDGTIKCASGVVTWDAEVAKVDMTDFAVFLQFYTEWKSYQIARIYVHPVKIASISWIRLFEGAYTADTLPEYVPTRPAAELLECQRYYYQPNVTDAGLALMHVSYSGYTFIPIMAPTTMRVKPSIVVGQSMQVYVGVWSDIDASVFAVIQNNNMYFLQARTTNFTDLALTAGMSYLVRYLPAMSADL